MTSTVGCKSWIFCSFLTVNVLSSHVIRLTELMIFNVNGNAQTKKINLISERPSWLKSLMGIFPVSHRNLISNHSCPDPSSRGNYGSSSAYEKLV